MKKENSTRKKEIANASWLVAGKVFQMVLSLLISLLTVRFLGPSNYGIINYVAAYVTFFTSLCTLGINSIIIKDFVDHPNEQGEALGTTILMRFISSTLSIILIVAIVALFDYNEKTTLIVAILSSSSLLFQVFDTINYWFQNQYKSKITSIVTLVGYVITSIYRIFLLVNHRSVEWFALASSIDCMVIAILLLVTYKKSNGPKFKISISKGISLISKSYHYILSDMMIAIYTQTDRLMLKQMLSETEVGYYSAAVSISHMWPFVLQAIIDSVYPTIMSLHEKDKKAFERKNMQLYAIVFYVSVFASVAICIVGPWIVPLLYGKEFIKSVEPLTITVWCTVFAYLGVARNAWIVCEGMQKFLKYMYCGASLINVFLNYVMIPAFGVSGAALASLITQIFTCLIFPWFFKGMRNNAVLMLKAITLKDIFSEKHHSEID